MGVPNYCEAKLELDNNKNLKMYEKSLLFSFLCGHGSNVNERNG